MKDQLIHYVDLLFAGAPNANDIKQEILQNTLDRYDDLVSQGKQPEAAYSLAISGIGDVTELLGSTAPQQFTPPRSTSPVAVSSTKRSKPIWKKVLLAVAVFLYIISIIPMIILSEMGMDVIGLCGMLSIVAVATVAIIISSGSSEKEVKQDIAVPTAPQQELRKAVKSGINTVGLVVYFAVSFLTQAWYITWLIFPIMAAVQGLANACMDLKEAGKYEG